MLALLDLRDLTRIVVTDSTGLAVYDSAAENNIRGKYTLYPELVRALEAHLPPIDAFDRFPGSAGALPRLG